MAGSEWVSVGDRLPDVHDDSLTIAEGYQRVYAMTYYPASPDEPAEWACAQGDGWGIPCHAVTHWMPMPTPPAV